MKQINISVSFDDEKLRALNKYLKKKELTAEDELAAALLHLYEKHVPAAVREYIDEDDGWDRERSYRVPGKYSTEHNVVIFRLYEAETIERAVSS